MIQLNEYEITQLLIELLEEVSGNKFLEDDFDMSAKAFEETGLLTHEAGLVLKVNGREFQITVARAK
jgi:hypothetical protein